MVITVSIVEDDEATRESLSHLLSREEEFDCISLHRSAEDAIKRLPELKPNVVLMDINLPGMSGVAAVRKLKALLPKTQFIMSTVYKDNDAIFSAVAAGANGYLLKQTPPKELLAALRTACDGGSPITSQIARKIVEAFRETQTPTVEMEGLTAREQEVLGLLAQGHLNKEIADMLNITYRTVATHTEHIYNKLHVRSRTEAVAKHLRKARTGPSEAAGGGLWGI